MVNNHGFLRWLTNKLSGVSPVWYGYPHPLTTSKQRIDHVFNRRPFFSGNRVPQNLKVDHHILIFNLDMQIGLVGQFAEREPRNLLFFSMRQDHELLGNGMTSCRWSENWINAFSSTDFHLHFNIKPANCHMPGFKFRPNTPKWGLSVYHVSSF